MNQATMRLKRPSGAPSIGIALVLALNAAAQTPWYVATNGTGNGTSWLQATNSLQGAIDAAGAGDTVWVSNGVYAAGGRPAGGTLATNRIVIDKAITVRAASGDPADTVIEGAASSGVLHHADAVRCVWMGANAKLIGFTLTGGATMTNKHVYAVDSMGGGAFCSTASALLSNCVIRSSTAYDTGGGVRSGTLRQCLVLQNTARVGGGCDSATLSDSSIVSNTASSAGGGANGGTLTRCVVLGNAAKNPPSGVVPMGGGTYTSTLYDSRVEKNTATYGGGCYFGTLTRCMILDNSGTYGGGARAATLYNCLLIANRSGWDGGGAYQSTLYNCVLYGNQDSNTGGGAYGGTLYNCISWNNRHPDTSTYYNSCGVNFTQPGSTTNNPLFYSPSANDFRLRPDSPCIDTGLNQGWMATATDYAGAPRILPVDGTVDMGAYEYDAANPPRMDWYVATNGVGDGGSWAQATNNIQDAIDAAPEGCTIWVSNGVYAVGGRNNYPAGTLLTNRLVIDKALTVRSASPDPSLTVIRGAHSSNGLTNGPGAVRCVYLANGATLIGFTLTNGATLAAGNVQDRAGGGAFVQSMSAMISNCLIIGNNAHASGGGVFEGCTIHCRLIGNRAMQAGGGVFGGQHTGGLFINNKAVNTASEGGGARTAKVIASTFIGNDAYYGGATYFCTMTDCMIISNSALFTGGIYAGSASNCMVMGNSGTYGCGARAASLFNCLLYRNYGYEGGGAHSCKLHNCTTADNVGPGAYGGTMTNTISWGNSKTDTATYSYSCGPGFSGNNSIAADPRFINAGNGDYRLRGSSPCIDTGLNQAWMTGAIDLDGHDRIAPGTGQVDMGAYEYTPFRTLMIVR